MKHSYFFFLVIVALLILVPLQVQGESRTLILGEWINVDPSGEFEVVEFAAHGAEGTFRSWRDDRPEYSGSWTVEDGRVELSASGLKWSGIVKLVDAVKLQILFDGDQTPELYRRFSVTKGSSTPPASQITLE